MLKNLLPLAAFAVVLASGAMVSPLRADELDRKTVITINEAIGVQGTVLNPGEYVLKLLDTNYETDIVQVFDRDEKHLITSVRAIPISRPEPPDNTVFTFYEEPPNQPAPLQTWFYPGETDGFEFQNVTTH